MMTPLQVMRLRAKEAAAATAAADKAFEAAKTAVAENNLEKMKILFPAYSAAMRRTHEATEILENQSHRVRIGTPES